MVSVLYSVGLEQILWDGNCAVGCRHGTDCVGG
jgi:hypothetical protein